MTGALLGKFKDLRGKGGPGANKYLKAETAPKKKGNIGADIVPGSSHL